MLIAHTLLRRCIRLMAQHVQVEPVRISVHTARRAIVGMLRGAHLVRAGTVPEHMRWLLKEAGHFVLPQRRLVAQLCARGQALHAQHVPNKEIPARA